MYGYIYKITNRVNLKLYIGQTRRTVSKRFQEHLTRADYYCKRYGNVAYKYMHLYLAMVKYGKDNFSVETIDYADSQEELDEKEKFWIHYFDTVTSGYNMLEGSTKANPMDSTVVKAKHDLIMQSDEVKAKISKTLSNTLKKNGRSEAYRRKISEAQRDRKCFVKDGKRTYTAGANTEKINQLLEEGWLLVSKDKKVSTRIINTNNIFATRSVPVYCILNTGERFDFESILDAGLWWYQTEKPFGNNYSEATYQRKIKMSIQKGEITGRICENNKYKNIKITNIQWFYK
jgi:group I intron endonuclease